MNEGGSTKKTSSGTQSGQKKQVIGSPLLEAARTGEIAPRRQISSKEPGGPSQSLVQSQQEEQVQEVKTETVQAVKSQTVETKEEEKATIEVRLYLTPTLDKRLGDLRDEYRRQTGKRIAPNAIMRKLIGKATLEDLLDGEEKG